MYMSQKEFNAMMKKNPRLRVHGANNNTREHRSKANKAAKYRNVKVYEYADGLAFSVSPAIMVKSLSLSLTARRSTTAGKSFRFWSAADISTTFAGRCL